MQQRQNDRQLELFSEQSAVNQTPQDASRQSFFRYARNYEKAILLFVAIFICGIIAFALGVDKGKKMYRQTIIRMAQARAILKPAASVMQPEALSANKTQIRAVPAPVRQDTSKYYYTVQVASFQSKKTAQKEAQFLKNKGLAPLILAKGKFVTLCVGNFSDRQTAQSASLELRKFYKDCFIRRI